MTNGITLVESGRIIDLEGNPANADARTAWLGYPVERHTTPATGYVEERWNPNPLVALTLAGGFAGVMQQGRRQSHVQYSPETITVFQREFEVDRAWWDGAPTPTICVELRSLDWQHLGGHRCEIPTLRTVFCDRDPQLAQLIMLMQREAEAGAKRGPMYSEALSLALLAHVTNRFAAGDPPAPRRLRPSDLHVIRQYVEDHLHEQMMISHLGGLIDLSPSHFTRVFKEATGQTPYRFVQQARVSRAKTLLKTPMPIAEIATTVGFSSQAHFTQVFRNTTGTTPARFRGATRQPRRSQP
jgi:AraC family transcriptional regulator